jgi:hypothetical protein
LAIGVAAASLTPLAATLAISATAVTIVFHGCICFPSSFTIQTARPQRFARVFICRIEDEWKMIGSAAKLKSQ